LFQYNHDVVTDTCPDGLAGAVQGIAALGALSPAVIGQQCRPRT